MPPRPFVVGIVGPSGSGKSSLASALATSLGGAVFAEDPVFYKAAASASYEDRDPVSETPAHVNWPQYIGALREAIEGMVDMDVTHGGTRSASDTPPVLLVEHFLLLHRDEVARALDAVIFLDVGADVRGMTLCMERRVARNPTRPAHECDALRGYYKAHVWPGYLRHSHAEVMKMRGGTEGKHFLRIDATTATVDLAVAEAVTAIRAWVAGRA